MYGFKVSRAGKDVSSSNPQDFIFNSNLGSVNIVIQPPNKTAQTQVVNASSTATVTIAHNLGYVPMCMVFVELTPGSGRWYGGAAYPAPIDTFANTVVIDTFTDGTYADATNLVIKFVNNKASQQTVSYYYFILGDSAV